MSQPYKKEHYQIGIICALHTEAAAMIAMLDERHPKQAPQKDDPNDYSFGRIGVHNLVIACLPAGHIGNTPATSVASNMKRSFPIRIGLMVGIGGGAPSNTVDIRLGDIAVSQPTGPHGGVFQWDFGKTKQGGQFHHSGTLDKPPIALLNALQSLKTSEELDGIPLKETLATMAKNKPQMVEERGYKYQGTDKDQLFQSIYDHPTGETCENCDDNKVIKRTARASTVPRVFYGNIASGNQVMEHGITRDRIAQKEKVICFEMEAAGLMDNFPCLVIRGICDYADSHKNKIWQKYAAVTAAAFARILLDFVEKQEVADTPVQKQYTVVPLPRNTDFIGRHDIFQKLDQLLPRTGAYQTAAIWGLGGCGKTQIALEYTYSWQQKTSGSIFWVRGDTEASFSQGYNDIAKEAGISLDLKGEDLLLAVQKWIEKLPNWLFIVDNVDDLRIFKEAYGHHNTGSSPNPELLRFVPRKIGIVLWTSRDNSILGKLVDYSRGVEVRGMSDPEALKLFQIRSGRPQSNPSCNEESELLNLLENLPLAISQTAAYIRSTRSTVNTYIEMLKESETELLGYEFSDPHRQSDIPSSVMKTWIISMKKIAQENQCAEKILNTIAYLDNQGLPFEVISAACGDGVKKHEVLLAAGRLVDYSFLQTQTTVAGELPTYQEHRLVQLATRQALTEAKQDSEFSSNAIQIMDKLFPGGTHETWNLCRVYLPHALKSVSWKEADRYEDLAPEFLGKIGRYYWQQGRSNEAEQLELQALDLWKRLLGEEHPDTIQSMANLASTWQQQGRSNDAEQLMLQVLDLRKSMLGEEHPDTILAMANLASTWRQQGRYNEAEQLEMKVLDLQKRVLGEEHPDTILAMANLASTWRQQGRYNEAEQLEIQVLDLQKRVLREEHPHTILVMANLASTWQQQGRYNEAEQLEMKVLDLQKRVLGEEHPDTILAMANLASTWWQQGRYNEAEQLEMKVLDLQKRVLGEEHPDTILAMANLASTWRQQGRYNEAEQLEIQVLDLGKRVLGEEHPDTILAMENLASTYYKQQCYDEAEKLEVDVLNLRRKILGDKHPDTILSRKNLAETYKKQGRDKEGSGGT
ncbi:hypothetical protein V492_00079 [Pseudogymnoascus sp. VKM F-4246]|nr:hypothetical protein V492_00079 [Pseudogymnoascus sp. VKM F-4246]